MPKCTRCGSEKFVKNGKVKEKQRYRCKDCQYNYTLESESDCRKQDNTQMIDRKVLQMLLDGIPQKRIIKYSKGKIISDKVGSLYKKMMLISSKYNTKPIRTIYSVDELGDFTSEVIKVLRENKSKTTSGVLIVGLDASTPFSAEISVVEKKEREE